MDIDRRNFLHLSGFAAFAGAAGSLDRLGLFLKKPAGERAPLFRRDVFRRDAKSPVAVVGGGGPGTPEVANMVRRAVELLGGIGKMGVRGKAVLVKPNVVAARRNPTTTSPQVVKAAVELLYEAGAEKVFVGDMSALIRGGTRGNMEKTGIARAAREAGAETVYFEEHEWFRVKLPGGKYIREVDVTEWFFRVDRVVNLPVVKTHSEAGYSICLKNLIGATHFRHRPYFVDREHWEEVVAEIGLAARPDLNIIDATTIMAAGGPFEGRDVRAGLVMASGDRVAADAVGLALVKSYGLDRRIAEKSVWRQRQLAGAVELGLGVSGRDEIRLLMEGEGFEGLFGKMRDNLA